MKYTNVTAGPLGAAAADRGGRASADDALRVLAGGAGAVVQHAVPVPHPAADQEPRLQPHQAGHQQVGVAVQQYPVPTVTVLCRSPVKTIEKIIEIDFMEDIPPQ